MEKVRHRADENQRQQRFSVEGYSWLAAAFLLIYVLPLMTLGLLRLARGRLSALPPEADARSATIYLPWA
ncbi:MAG: hypothetical protein WC729_01885 [Sphingomonas sp.]|uniref:hypothetical protein n=1 Tax=Sphingomonas sp. TaxID=28214 RepID=UPI003569F5A8